MGDLDRYIHLEEIFVDFIQRPPTSVLELVFKDDAGVKQISNKFNQGDLIHWSLNMHARTHTSATLTIQQSLSNISVAVLSVEFETNEFRDYSVVELEDSNHCVAVNIVCGRSKSLADVTRVLGSQACTAPTLKVPTFLASQLAAQLYTTIHRLNDDILLNIFNCYRLDKNDGWNLRLGWCKLSHVCQRWRHLIYESTVHLGMHIQCTNGTPIVDILDHLPPLPLLLDYSGTITELDELGIYHALRLHDRVRRIDLHLLPSILHKYLALMDEHFPILEHLSLSFTAEKFATLTLPKPFRAPNLRHLDIPGIGSPKRLRLLISTVSLVTLALRNIQTSSYFRPRLLVARLGSLPQLEELSIGFSIPIPRPNAEIELFGELGATVTLPNLKTLMFRGVSAYLESLVAQIRVPLLGTLDITLFNQTAFALPHLSHLINNTEGFMLPAAKVYFNHDGVSIIMAQPGSRWFDGPFRLRVMCKQLDWQIDCAAQICSTLVHTLSGVELCTLDPYTKTLPSELKNGEIDSTTWQELLRSFIGLKELYVYGGLLEELSRALLADGVGAEPGFLPGLQSIVAEDNLFARFINARRAVGHPVLFLPSP